MSSIWRMSHCSCTSMCCLHSFAFSNPNELVETEHCEMHWVKLKMQMHSGDIVTVTGTVATKMRPWYRNANAQWWHWKTTGDQLVNITCQTYLQVKHNSIQCNNIRVKRNSLSLDHSAMKVVMFCRLPAFSTSHEIQCWICHRIAHFFFCFSYLTLSLWKR